MYYIGICDDDLSFIKYIERIFSEVDKEIEFYEYLSGEALIQDMKNRERYDVLVLDVAMPGMDGNETARNFRTFFPDTMLIFCSGVCLPTVESFETTPYRYWLKKYSEEKMRKEAGDVMLRLKKNKTTPYIMGKKEQQMVRLSSDEMSYIAIAKKGAVIHCGNSDEIYTTHKKVAELYEQLKDFGFAYAHNSYIVNLKYVVMLDSKELELMSGEKLTISRARAKEFKMAFALELAKKYGEDIL